MYDAAFYNGDAINRRPQGEKPREMTMSNLQEFHHAEEAPDIKSRTVVAVFIAVLMAGLGVYVYEQIWNPPAPPQAVTDSQLPAH